MDWKKLLEKSLYGSSGALFLVWIEDMLESGSPVWLYLALLCLFLGLFMSAHERRWLPRILAKTTTLDTPSKYWINEKEALSRIGRSAYVVGDRPIENSVMSHIIRKEEIERQQQHDRELSYGILLSIIDKHPRAKKGDRYSFEIIVKELSIMLVEKGGRWITPQMTMSGAGL